MELRKGKRYLLFWAVFCLLMAVAGMAVPVEQIRSLGLEGANQANLKEATEELTKGRVLEFVLESPMDTARRIGFFFTVKEHEFTEGTLRITAFDGDTLVGGRDFPLAELTEDQFLSVELENLSGSLRVRMETDAKGAGPAVWLNETTVTPGTATMDGEQVSKSLVYNLAYTVRVHQFQRPFLMGCILLLFGIGIYGAGGFTRPERPRTGFLKWGFVKPSFRQFLLLCAMVFLGALLFYYLYDTKIRIAQNTTEKATVLESDGETLPVSKATASISQRVKPQEDRLTGLGVRFYLEEGTILERGSMHASVTDLALGQVLCETDVQASQFLSGEYVGLLFHDSQTGVRNHEYQIDLSFSEELWDSGLSLMTSQEGLCVNAYLYFNIFLKRFFFFLFLGVEGFLCLFWYLAFVKRSRLENVFLVTVLFFGLVYNVMLAPQMVPDEAKHIDMAYRYSNELLGFPSLGDTKCLMRADDAALEFTSSPSFGNYRNIYYGLFSRVQDDRMVEADISSRIEGNFLLYAPAVLGMTLARLLHWGTVPMLLLARYLNLCVFALLAWAGMRRLPFGKMTLFVLALLPVNLQQCASFSYDAMVHGLLFFYCCLCLKAICSRERLDGQEMALLELFSLLCVYCKGGSYLPLALLPILVPRARYAGKREKALGTAALLGIPVLSFAMEHIRTVSGIVGTTAATSVVSTGDGAEYLTGYTIGYFMGEPLKFVYMLVNTLFDKIGFYLESLIGYQLGWVEIETSMLVVFLFWSLLFLSTCDVEGEDRVRLKGKERLVMIFVCLCCMGLILLGMLFRWTPFGHVSIEGVQGRYFLPFLPVLLAACRGRLVALSRNIDRGIASAVLVGQLLTLMYLIKQVMAV